MIIAIPANTNNPEDKISTDFVTTNYFAIHNTETKETNFLNNPNTKNNTISAVDVGKELLTAGVNKIYTVTIEEDLQAFLNTEAPNLEIEKVDDDQTIDEIINQTAKQLPEPDITTVFPESSFPFPLSNISATK